MKELAVSISIVGWGGAGRSGEAPNYLGEKQTDLCDGFHFVRDSNCIGTI